MEEQNPPPAQNTIPEDDWAEEPIVVAVTSPQDKHSSKPTKKIPSPEPQKTVRARNVKTSKVSPSKQDNGPPSNMPFDF